MRKLAISEKSIQAAVMDYLQLDGWRVFHFEYGFDERSKKTHGELGMPDLLSVRYHCTEEWFEWWRTCGGINSVTDIRRVACETLWIELKSELGSLSPAQRIWHIAEQNRGGLVWTAGYDFPPTIEGWLEHYRKSGLNRRPI